ncbi:PAS domain S-box protein [Salinimicrobium sp. MT39]|uniref:histidine kinase n=1 Tax=Salinimicrobium profundisediminis TaxID=2994553 RepID=A0A9X3CUN6_9FLAO|nr:PAS domain S-box protein [Salinimicrobium profundisediminis]MCX2837167.1 PAS domain S-box protein [Salinimicrobium profundisediminis]
MQSNDEPAIGGSGGMGVEFRHLLDGSPVANYICDAEGRLTYFNKAAIELWGRTPILGKEYWCGSWKILYEDGTPMPLEDTPISRVLKKGVEEEKSEIRIECPNGAYKYLLVFPKPLFDRNGKLEGVHCTLVDITEQKRDHIKKETLSAIVQSSDDAIISKNLQGVIASWNRGAQEIFGYSEDETVGRSITMLIPEERLNEEDVILDKIKRGIKIDHFETIRKHKSGRDIPVSITVSPVKDSGGNIVGASKVARDITARIESQAAMKKYIRNLETLNTVGKSISENLNVEGILQRVTDATTSLTGAAFGAFFYNNSDDKGSTFQLFTLSGAPREIFDHMAMPRHTDLFLPTFRDRKVVRIDDVTKHGDFGKNAPYKGMPKGHFSVVSYLAIPVISKNGAVIGGLLYGHPEAGKFTAEHELLVINIAAQAAVSLDNSKLFEQVKSLSEKKDEFIALASHELKTPLTTIKGYLQVLSKKKADKVSQLFLDKSLCQVDKLNTLVEDLLNMSRIESGQLNFNLEVFDIREMLKEIVETFSYSSQSHRVTGTLWNDSVIIEGDKQRIEQAILNLMTNAIKYSPKADEIFVDLEVVGENMVVKVRDMGIGLTEEQRRQLFTRFYRAEDTQGISGLGLGLYLTKQIIDRHGGSIEVASEYGMGSEFSLILPLAVQKLKKVKAI